MQTTNKLNRDDRFADAHHGYVGIDNLTILPVTYTGETMPTRFLVNHRVTVGPGMVQSEIALTREQMVWLRDKMTDLLNETDPAYIAHMEKAAALGEIQPASDEEYAAYLAGEVKS